MKNFYKFGWLVIAMALLVAAGTQSNQWDFGDGTSADKVTEYKLGLGSNNPKIKATTTGINFANDGVNFLPLGSGTGGGSGGENVVANPGFETGTTNWTNTGSGAIATTTTAANVGFGDASGDWDAAAAADKLTTDVQITPNGIANTLCIAEMFYKGGGTSNITMRVIDGSDVLIPGFNEVVIVDAATSFKRAFTEFICPAEGTSMKFQLEAAGDAPNLYIDNIHVGTKTLTRSVATTGDKAFTPTVSQLDWTLAFQYRQDGNNIDIKGKATVTGLTGQSASAVDFTLPSGLSLDTSTALAIGIDGRGEFGSGVWSDAGTPKGIETYFVTTTTFAQSKADDATGTTAIRGTDLAIGDILTFNFSTTISEFDGTVNLLNNSVIGSSDKMSVFGLTAVATTVSGVVKEITTWDTANLSTTGGGSFDGTTYTVASEGNYTIRASMRWGNAITATDAVIYIYKNGVGVKREHHDFAATGGPSMSVDFDTDLVVGDLITIHVSQNSGGNEDTRVSEQELAFYVKRNAEVSSESPLGFGLADADNAGLVSNESIQELDIGADASFTSGTLFLAKTGKVVTISQKTAVNHASGSSSYATAAGFIPVGFRPPVTTYNMFIMSGGGTYIKRVSVDATGVLGVNYTDYVGGSKTNQTTTGGFTISYVVE